MTDPVTPPTPASAATTLAQPPAQQTPGESLYQPIPPRQDAPVEAAPAEPPATPPVQPEAPVEAAPAPTEKPAETPAPLELKLPDGFQADQNLLTKLNEALSTDGLSKQELGQKIVDLAVEQQKAQDTAWQTMQQDWVKAIEADPVLGGSNLKATQETLGKALDVYGNDAVREAFALTGAGNNPDVVRFIHKMATALNEGSYVAPRGPANGAGKRSAGQILYGDNPQQ